MIGGPLELGAGESAGIDHVYGGWGNDLVDDGDDDSDAVDADRLDGGSCDPFVDGFGQCRDDGPNAGDFDVVDWSGRTAAVRVDLGESGATQGMIGAGGADAEHETLVNLDAAYGGDGDDLLTGTGADELFDGGPGADVMDGAGGFDWVSYADRTEPISVALRSPAAIQGAAGEGDTIVATEAAAGGEAGDRLTGDAAQNALYGGPGDDVIRSDGDLGSADYADCEAGSDSLTRDADDTVDDCEAVTTAGGGGGGPAPPGPAPQPPPVIFDSPFAKGTPVLRGSLVARVRVGRGGSVTLRGHRVGCPKTRGRCRVSATLRGRGSLGKLASRRLTVAPGHSWTIELQLGPKARNCCAVATRCVPGSTSRSGAGR